MKKRISLPLSLAALFAASIIFAATAAPRALAQLPAKRADTRIARTLDGLGIPYQLMKDNNYKVEVQIDNNRTQVVVIESTVLTAKGTKPFRTVRSTAMFTSGAVPAAVQNRLKKANEEFAPSEPWQIYKYKDGSTVDFEMSADADGSDLDTIIEQVAEEADKMEQEITGQDEF